MQFDFGNVKNVGEEPTKVVLELAYKIHRTAQNSSGVTALAKLNGNKIQLPTFDIVQNVSHQCPSRAGQKSICMKCVRFFRLLQMRSQWLQRVTTVLDAINSTLVAREQFSSM